LVVDVAVAARALKMALPTAKWFETVIGLMAFV